MVAAVDRAAIARAQRRQQALDSLASEREREAALVEHLEEMVTDAEGWRIDEEVFAKMDGEQVALLRETPFHSRPPGADERSQLEEEIAELELDLAECRRRQRAYERYLDELAP